jgi:hypothetical protein
MLVNQIQRDMNRFLLYNPANSREIILSFVDDSSNQLETCAALTAVCKIVTADMVPAVIGDVCYFHDIDIDLISPPTPNSIPPRCANC